MTIWHNDIHIRISEALQAIFIVYIGELDYKFVEKLWSNYNKLIGWKVVLLIKKKLSSFWFDYLKKHSIDSCNQKQLSSAEQ